MAKKSPLLLLSLAFLWFSPGASAQSMHSDVRFGFDVDRIVVQVDEATGARVGVGDFALAGFFRQFEANPGFASEFEDGLGINPSDQIAYNVLNDLLFWDGTGFAAPDPSAQIIIENNGSAPTVVTSTSGLQSGSFDPSTNLVGEADNNGEFHSHVNYYLEPNNAPDSPPLPDLGAYGLLLSLSTDAAGISDSDPFLIVFNFGLDLTVFDEAVEDFASLLSTPLPGDYDRSGLVDGADFLLWQRQLGDSVGPHGSGADGNSDGSVGMADLVLWQDQYGTNSTLSAGSTISVPETASVNILLFMLLWGLVSRHRNFVLPKPDALWRVVARSGLLLFVCAHR